MSEDRPSQLNLRNCQLLIVDDEENVLKAIRRQFHRTFKVHVAASAEEAYTILRENRIDVVLADQRMPGTTGAEFLTQVRQEFPDTLRFMLTGYADINAVIAAINDGHVERYIQKPWDAGELERIIAASYQVQALKTENERLASELATAFKAEQHFNQLQSHFITLVSHEFRTPLAVIMAAAETVRVYHTRLEPEKIETKLDRIIDQVQLMKHLLEEILAVGAYEHGIRTFQPEAMDICSHFRACIDSIRVSLSGQPSLVTHVPEDCSDFVGDAHIITEVVTELVTNALKFSTHSGTIICKLVVDSTRAVISIADEGTGITDHDLERIFKPFVKGENADTVHGLGLGLAIVRHAVNLHRGQIFVERNDQGGTTIRVILQSLSDIIDLQGHL